jgi:hypothetical protein
VLDLPRQRTLGRFRLLAGIPDQLIREFSPASGFAFYALHQPCRSNSLRTDAIHRLAVRAGPAIAQRTSRPSKVMVRPVTPIVNSADAGDHAAVFVCSQPSLRSGTSPPRPSMTTEMNDPQRRNSGAASLPGDSAVWRMIMFRKSVVLLLALFVTQALMAQELGRVAPVRPAMPCPHPFSQTLTGGPSGPSAPVVADFPTVVQGGLAGSVWNQTATDKYFGHTFRFPELSGNCCLITKGTLTVTIKALNSGVKGASAANNDAVNVYSNGALIGQQQPWLNSGVTAGTTATVTFTIPATALATGMVSFLVQDDSAAVSAQLVIEGCCLRKP